MSTSLQITADSIIDQRFRLIKRIGVGGMGEVWRAEHLRLPSSVAIKFLYTHQMDEEALQRFEREAHIMATLNHAHITRVTDFNTLSDGTPYIVLEYLEGEPLSDRLLRGALDQLSVKEIVMQVGSALNATHSKGIIHRDLKPDNIFLCRLDDGQNLHAKVLDFGVSKIKSKNSLHLTQDQRGFLGTPHYMSPEQAKGSNDVDHRADQFALAIICYEMLVGCKPFNGNTILEIAAQVIHNDPTPVHHLQPELSQNTSACLTQALAKNPIHRYSSCKSFVHAFCQSLQLDSYDDFAQESRTEISTQSISYNPSRNQNYQTITMQTPGFVSLDTLEMQSQVDPNAEDLTLNQSVDLYKNLDTELNNVNEFQQVLNTPPIVSITKDTEEQSTLLYDRYPEAQSFLHAQAFPKDSMETYNPFDNVKLDSYSKPPKRSIFFKMIILSFIMMSGISFLWFTTISSPLSIKEQSVQINRSTILQDPSWLNDSEFPIKEVRLYPKYLNKKMKRKVRTKELSILSTKRKLKFNKYLTVFIELTKPITKPSKTLTYWLGGSGGKNKEFELKLHPLNPKKGQASIWYATYTHMSTGRWVINVMQDKKRIAYIPIQVGSLID